VQVYLVVAENLGVTIAAAALIAKLWSDRRGRFLRILCFIIIVTDLSAAFLIVGFGLESVTPFVLKRKEALSIEIGISMSLFYAGCLNLHWLVAFKYWAISQEMQKVLDREIMDSSNQKKYQILNASGIVLALAVSFWMGTSRGLYCYEDASKRAPPSLI